MDQRERNSDLLSALKAARFDIEVKTIPIGDYVISDRICIERKTTTDFESSIMSGRIFEQLERLHDGYESPIIILEGDREAFRLGSNVITGTIVSIYVDYGIPVIMSESPKNTAEIITMIARREQRGGKRVPSLKGSTRAYTARHFQEFIIGNLPGIGPKLAKSLLVHFKSVRAVANAGINDLMEVEKIGKKKADMIHDTINEVYKEEQE